MFINTNIVNAPTMRPCARINNVEFCRKGLNLRVFRTVRIRHCTRSKVKEWHSNELTTFIVNDRFLGILFKHCQSERACVVVMVVRSPADMYYGTRRRKYRSTRNCPSPFVKVEVKDFF